MIGVECVIEAAIEAVLEKRRWNRGSRLCAQRGHERQLLECRGRFSDRGMLALPFIGEESEEFVFLDWTADGAAKPLPGIWRVDRGGGAVSVRRLLVRIEGLIAEKAEG